MISRCLLCHSPIFNGSCLCGQNVTRCPDCDGDGRKKTIELLEDQDGYMGYVRHPQKEYCPLCGGLGRVTIAYKRVIGD